MHTPSTVLPSLGAPQSAARLGRPRAEAARRDPMNETVCQARGVRTTYQRNQDRGSSASWL